MSAAALRTAADILDAIPGLPPVYVSVNAGNIGIQLSERDGVRDDTRAVAVDMLAGVLGFTAEVQRARTDRPWEDCYRAEGKHRGYWVNVYAPHCAVIRRDPVVEVCG